MRRKVTLSAEDAAKVAEAESYTDYQHLTGQERANARHHDPSRNGRVPNGWSIIAGYATSPKDGGPISVSYLIMPSYDLAAILHRKRRPQIGHVVQLRNGAEKLS